MDIRLALITRLCARVSLAAMLLPLVARAAAPPPSASATSAETQCVANFQESGDPRNGATYSSFVTFPKLDIHSALGQMEKYAQDQKFAIGAETYKGDQGQLIVTQKDSGFLGRHHGFPFIIRADAKTNRLSTTFRLNQGQTTTAESARGAICRMMSKVKMDAVGAVLAATMRAQTHSDAIINIKARDLAAQVDRKMIGHAFSVDSIASQYIGRTYRIDGQVEIAGSIGRESEMMDVMQGKKSLDLTYDTRMNNAADRILGVKGPGSSIGVICHTDPAQVNRFLQLRDQDYATLIGKVTNLTYDAQTLTGEITLACHYEK